MFYLLKSFLRALLLVFCTATTPVLATTSIEFYHAGINHYFMTAYTDEAVSLDSKPEWNWARTGKTFNVWLTQASAPSNASPVCRFYGVFSNGTVGSHFYTIDQEECAYVKSRLDWGWDYEGEAFYAVKPTGGACPSGTAPVYRAYNNGMGGAPNHRYMASQAEMDTMVAQGWSNESIVMCSGSSSSSVSSALPSSVLGNAIISLGTGGQSIHFPADGTPVSLHITDASGYIWKLDIAGNAIELPTTITITPLASVTGQGTPGSLASGLMLEPDGLRFLAPVTLTVTPPAAAPNALILTANHDGAALEFAETTSQGGFSAPLYHFSTAFVADPSTAPQQWESAARADYEAAKTVATDLLNQPLEALPEPPSAVPDCNSETEIRQFLEALPNPEASVIKRLLGAARALSLLGIDVEQAALDLAVQLSNRVVNKATSLVNSYKPQPDKFMAVARAVLETQRVAELLGSDADFNQIHSTLAEWGKQATDQYLSDLRTKHDYTLAQVLIPMARLASILGADDPLFVDKYVNAMTFTAEYDVTLTNSSTTAIKTTSEVVVTPSLTGAWVGSGNGWYTSAQFLGPTTMVLPNTFPVNVKINNFDACVNKTVDLYVDRFGATTETLVNYEGVGAPIPGLVNLGTISMFGMNGSNPMTSDVPGFFKFTLPIQNLQETAAQDNLQSSVLDIQLRLMHTPK